MVDADQLCIVFHVNGLGFVMPVANLLAFRGKGEDALTAVEQFTHPCRPDLWFTVRRMSQSIP